MGDSFSAEQAREILLWGGGLLGLLVVGGGIVWYYRQRLLGREPSDDGTPWTLDDLHRMRAEGQLTEEEYQALRQAMIAEFRALGGNTPSGGRSAGTSGPTGLAPGRENAPDLDLRNRPDG